MFFHQATVICSHPDLGWGLAEMLDKKQVVFFRTARACTFKLRGTELIAFLAENLQFPEIGDEIGFRDVLPAEHGGRNPQAGLWASLEYFKMMNRASAKAAVTQRRIADQQAKIEKAKQTFLERRYRKLGFGAKKVKKFANA